MALSREARLLLIESWVLYACAFMCVLVRM